jgi:hypothetical protein
MEHVARVIQYDIDKSTPFVSHVARQCQTFLRIELVSLAFPRELFGF